MGPRKLEVLLVSTFEGGFQPVSVASAATALEDAGFQVSALDTYVEGVELGRFESADLIAISIPLFDSLGPGIEIARLVRERNRQAHVAFFGTYATINAARLTPAHGDSSITGDWESPLVRLASQLASDGLAGPVASDLGYHRGARDEFRVPRRDLLPTIDKYPQPHVNHLCGSEQLVGSTEVTRGCHHRCLYCSVFSAYDGKAVLIPQEVVLQDVANQVEAGMSHLTFVDAEFFNARHHAIDVLRKLHTSFPSLTYDLTTRVDHLLENPAVVEEMRGLGVEFITSALEFPSQRVLDALDKQLTLGQVSEAIEFVDTVGIQLNPTFIMFNPWVGLEDLIGFSDFVAQHNLADAVDPIQYETRLHLYKGSPLLRTPFIQSLELEEHDFHYDWKHPDPRVDEVYLESVTPPEKGVFKRCCLKC